MSGKKSTLIYPSPSFGVNDAAAPYCEDLTRRWEQEHYATCIRGCKLVCVVWPMTSACIILNLN